MTEPHSTDSHRPVEPLVTVVVPCFNAAEWLVATLETIRQQTFTALEVRMVDDGSTDGTAAILRSFAAADARFHAYICERNQGLVAARNVGLQDARGAYIALLDQDDLWTPDALASRVALATRHPTALVVATDFVLFEEARPDPPYQGRVMSGPRAKALFGASVAGGQPILVAEPFDAMATFHFAWVGATLVRRAALAAVGDFDPTFAGPEDTLVWLRLARRGPFVFSPQVTAFYRQRAGSITSRYRTPKEFHFLAVLHRIVADGGLAASERRTVRRTMADAHHVSALHARKHGSQSPLRAIAHAWNAVRLAPWRATYWKGLIGGVLDAVRSRAP